MVFYPETALERFLHKSVLSEKMNNKTNKLLLNTIYKFRSLVKKRCTTNRWFFKIHGQVVMTNYSGRASHKVKSTEGIYLLFLFCFLLYFNTDTYQSTASSLQASSAIF